MFYRVSFILSIIEYKATKSQAKNREKATAWQKTANYLSIGVNNFIINFDSFKFLAGFLFLFSHFYGVNSYRFSHFYEVIRIVSHIFMGLIRIVFHIFIVIRVNIVKIIVAEIFAKNFQK